MQHAASFDDAWNAEQAQRARRLWASVILGVAGDAHGIGLATSYKKLTNRNISRRAHDWFVDGGRDFRFICECAGVDPQSVQNAYLAGRLHPDNLPRQPRDARSNRWMK